MQRAGLSWISVAVALVLGSLAPDAAAKRTGMNMPCHNCHEGQGNKPKLTVEVAPARVEPGQPVTVTVTSKHPSAKVGGVLVDSNGLGGFELIDAVGTQLFENTKTQVTHAMPKPYADGQVQFSFRWVTPTTPGAAVLDVWTNAANDNGLPIDDFVAEAFGGVSVGCDGAWYYLDGDKDGAGPERDKMFSCTPIADRVLKGGDCDDEKPEVGPTIKEVCNSIDDDCDGVVDNGFTPVLLVTDSDGDGYGSTSGKTMIGCPPVAGFATTFDDCNDKDASVHPGATEVANSRDDDCNGKLDDGVGMPANPTAGSGGGGSTGGSAGAGGGPTSAPPAAESSCAYALPARQQTRPLLGMVLLIGWAGMRTARRRLGHLGRGRGQLPG